MKYLLGIDFGGGASKATLLDTEGTIVAENTVEYPTLYPQNGACEQDPVIKDFFLSAYSSPMCLEIIRRNDTARARRVFAHYCPDWSQEQFAEAEILCSGIEYATLMTANDPVTLETRISGALTNILGIYGIPEELRQSKIRRVFAMDYRNLGKQTLTNFRQYVAEANDQAFRELLT